MGSYDVILHPTDFSEESDQAFQLACNMVRDQFASLVVVHVLPPESCDHGKSPAEIADDPGPAIRNCRDQFARMRSKAPDIPVSFRIVSGNAVGSILNVAHEEKAELIVIASHRHSQFHLQVHGSVAEGILRQSHCPVVVLRQPTPSLSHHSRRSVVEETT